MDNIRKAKLYHMDTKKIGAILAAVDRGSLTAAAAELGYTQSGLTHMMNALEDELGLNLLVRSKNGVRLSPAGQELLPKMRALMQAAIELENSAEHLRQHNYSTLRLGAYSSVTRQWLPAILSEFRRACPDTEVTIDVGGVHELYDKLKQDELDCAIVSYNETLCQGLGFIPLRDDPLLAVLPGDSVLPSGCFPVQDFAGREFLMPSAGFDLDINPIFIQNRLRTAPLVRYTNLDDAAIVSMVEHGLGASILSELVMQGMQDQVLAAPLDPPAFRRLGIASSERRQCERNIHRFVKCAQSVIGQMYDSEELLMG